MNLAIADALESLEYDKIKTNPLLLVYVSTILRNA